MNFTLLKTFSTAKEFSKFITLEKYLSKNVCIVVFYLCIRAVFEKEKSMFNAILVYLQPLKNF